MCLHTAKLYVSSSYVISWGSFPMIWLGITFHLNTNAGVSVFFQNAFGVCIHPKYGGWFAIRGVIIFKSVLCPHLQQTEPVDCVPQQEERVKLLELFTNHWKDWRYRDIIPVEKRYSEDQKQYFATAPKDRTSLILELREKYYHWFSDLKKVVRGQDRS